MAKGDYERYAVNLLLGSPTDLNRAWANAVADLKNANVLTMNIEKDVGAELKQLNFSHGVAEGVLAFAQANKLMRNVFKGVGDALAAGLYSGSEPHPTRAEMIKIIAALKEIE